MKVKFIYGLILLQVVVIAFLGYRIFQKGRQKNVLGAAAVTPLKKENLIFPKDGELKYYYEPKPNTTEAVEKSWLPYKWMIHYNSEGLNDRFDYSVVKPPDTYRIVALGDSFTNGEYVNVADNYPEKLENLLNSQMHCRNIKKFEVLNLGVAGYDIQYAVHRFKLHGAKYDPDLVIWFMFDNDFIALNELTVGKRLQYEAELKASGAADPEYVNGEFFPVWIKLSEEIYKEYGQDRLIAQGYKDLTGFSELYPGPLLIFTPNWTPPKFRELMKLYTIGRGNAYFYDELPDYDTLPDSHPSAKGYTTIVASLFNYLTREKIIPCE